MASRSASVSVGTGSDVVGQYPAWKYCSLVEGNKNNITYNYYGLMIKSGSITEFKFHLLHTNPNLNTKKCSKVKQEIKDILHKKKI